MIRFKLLIHKPSEVAITYEKWLELLEDDTNNISFNNKIEILDPSESKGVRFREQRFIYGGAKDLLFNDDFEIVYESDFTDEEFRELVAIYYGGELSRNLYEKINNKLLENKYYNGKYNIK